MHSSWTYQCPTLCRIHLGSQQKCWFMVLETSWVCQTIIKEQYSFRPLLKSILNKWYKVIVRKKFTIHRSIGLFLYTTGKESTSICLKHCGFFALPINSMGNFIVPVPLKQALIVTYSFCVFLPAADFLKWGIYRQWWWIFHKKMTLKVAKIDFNYVMALYLKIYKYHKKYNLCGKFHNCHTQLLHYAAL